MKDTILHTEVSIDAIPYDFIQDSYSDFKTLLTDIKVDVEKDPDNIFLYKEDLKKFGLGINDVLELL